MASASAAARRGRSRLSIASASRTASRALLVCSAPMRCRRRAGCAGRSTGNFAAASCTRFSPNTVCPAASAASTASAGWVFDTATRVTEPGGAVGAGAGLGDPVAEAGEVLGGWRRLDGGGGGGHAVRGLGPEPERGEGAGARRCPAALLSSLSRLFVCSPCAPAGRALSATERAVKGPGLVAAARRLRGGQPGPRRCRRRRGCCCSAIPRGCRTRATAAGGCRPARPWWRAGSRRQCWPRWRRWRGGGGSCCWWPATGGGAPAPRRAAPAGPAPDDGAAAVPARPPAPAAGSARRCSRRRMGGRGSPAPGGSAPMRWCFRRSSPPRAIPARRRSARCAGRRWPGARGGPCRGAGRGARRQCAAAAGGLDGGVRRDRRLAERSSETRAVRQRRCVRSATVFRGSRGRRYAGSCRHSIRRTIVRPGPIAPVCRPDGRFRGALAGGTFAPPRGGRRVGEQPAVPGA